MGIVLNFEFYTCENCGHLSGLEMKIVDAYFRTHDDSLIWSRANRQVLKTKNTTVMASEKDSQKNCQACQPNRTIPNLSDEENFEKWQNLEIAKHRLIYNSKNRFRFK
jgi:hypothetical protein